MQGKNIQEKHVFNSTKVFKPIAPQHNIINDNHNHMMATKACFALLGTKSGVREYGQEAVAAIISKVKKNLKERSASKQEQLMNSVD